MRTWSVPKEGRDLGVLAIIVLLSSLPIAFLTFSSMFPNVSTPSLESNILLAFLLAILVGIASGYFIMRSDLAVISVFLYTILGYILALVLYSMPYLLYDIEIVLPSFYYLIFFRFTFILIFVYILAGFIGVFMGGILRDSVRGEETRLIWERS